MFDWFLELNEKLQDCTAFNMFLKVGSFKFGFLSCWTGYFFIFENEVICWLESNKKKFAKKSTKNF